MNALKATLWFGLGLVSGSIACGPALTAQPGPASPAPPAERSPLGVPGGPRDLGFGAALLIDRNDLSIGTTVQYTRIPSLSELSDLGFVRGLAHLVLLLDEWPRDPAALQPLGRLPEGVDLIVVLQGYPPDRASAEAWNFLPGAARLIVVAEGPPPTGVIFDLNAMRSLERLIVDTQDPTRAGFERFQRPISFRVVRD